MTFKEAEERAKYAYAIYRGADRSNIVLMPDWESLPQWEREVFTWLTLHEHRRAIDEHENARAQADAIIG